MWFGHDRSAELLAQLDKEREKLFMFNLSPRMNQPIYINFHHLSHSDQDEKTKIPVTLVGIMF